jgi:threonyl-tRNA synthetase
MDSTIQLITKQPNALKIEYTNNKLNMPTVYSTDTLNNQRN